MPFPWPFTLKGKNKEKQLRRRLLDDREMPRALRIGLRTALFLVVPLVAHLLFPLADEEIALDLREGEISEKEVIAPFSFPIYRESSELERARAEAARAVPPVLEFDPALATGAAQKLRRLGRELVRPPSENLPPAELGAALERALGVSLSQGSLAFLCTREGQATIAEAAAYVERALAVPIVDPAAAPLLAGHDVVNARRGAGDFYRPAAEVTTVPAARAAAAAAADQARAEDPAARDAFHELVLPFIRVTAVYDPAETQRRTEQAKRDVPSIVGMVARGERIIDSHERITAEQLLNLRSMEAHRRELAIGGELGGGLLAGAGRFGAMALLLFAFLAYLRFQQPHVHRDLRLLALLATLGVLPVIATWLLVDHFHQQAFLVPIALSPLLAAILLPRGVALFLAFLAPVFLILLKGFSIEFLLAASVGGVGAVFAAENLKRRHELYQPVLVVALVNVLTAVAIGLATREPVSGVLAKGVLGILGAGLAGVVAIVLLPILEKIFRITTNFTLIELLDRNHPLLKRMVIEAPGTFHHSMLVAELAREAAEAAGGNPLLAQVGAYYHDIGKMQLPEYFVENQTGKNRHDNLTPNMSCLILGAHVRDGIQMAREAGLPPEIVDFIPEHHGTNLMSFFYHKAQDRDPAIEESDFRYPGPRPSRKETAIVMLADSVEATARSLEDPTPGRIRTVVKRIIDKRAEDGQLDGSSLTLADLARVRDSFIAVLDRFFHGRIQYPEAALRTRRMESEGAVGGPQGEVAPLGRGEGRDAKRDPKRPLRRGVELPDGDESVAVFEREDEEEDADAGVDREPAAPPRRLEERAPEDRPHRTRGA